MSLHPRLSEPKRGSNDAFVRDALLDLTVYVNTITSSQLDTLVAWYRNLCPISKFRRYKIEEIELWDDVHQPALLTRSGRAAAQQGAPLPFLAPVRRRIHEGRRFHIQFWDGAPTRSWSFCVRAMHRRDTGLHTFVRLMLPLDADAELLHQAASTWAASLDIDSGHGGSSFTYDPWHIGDAFDDIYALARRFWGIDVEHLNGTLPSMKDRIKGVSWLTLLGSRFLAAPGIAEGLARVEGHAGIRVEQQAQAAVIRIGAAPILADQNRDDDSIAGYQALASALSSIYVEDHPEFPGSRFGVDADTNGWIRRFIDPSGWR